MLPIYKEKKRTKLGGVAKPGDISKRKVWLKKKNIAKGKNLDKNKKEKDTLCCYYHLN